MKVDEFLVGDLGFESCPYDPCLYVLRKGDLLVIVVVYVDDQPVVYRLTRITCVPPATFTEILVHSEQQCITPENVLLTLRNTRF